MNYLVDTNVLCEPRQKRPQPQVVNWLEANESSLYTSVLVTGEIRYGIERLPAGSARRADLLAWYERLLSIMAGRVLSINARVAENGGGCRPKSVRGGLPCPWWTVCWPQPRVGIIWRSPPTT